MATSNRNTFFIIVLVFNVRICASQMYDFSDGRLDSLISYSCNNIRNGIWTVEDANKYPGGPSTGSVLTTDLRPSCLKLRNPTYLTSDTRFRMQVRTPFTRRQDDMTVFIITKDEAEVATWFKLAGPLQGDWRYVDEPLPSSILPAAISLPGEYMIEIWVTSFRSTVSIRYFEIMGNDLPTTTVTSTTTQESTIAMTMTTSQVTVTSTESNITNTTDISTLEFTTDNDALTSDSTTEMSTSDSTTDESTSDSTTEESTSDSTIEVSTSDSTTEMSTLDSTTDKSTSDSTTVESTLDSTTEMSTSDSTTEVSTSDSMTESTTVDNQTPTDITISEQNSSPTFESTATSSTATNDPLGETTFKISTQETTEEPTTSESIHETKSTSTFLFTTSEVTTKPTKSPVTKLRLSWPLLVIISFTASIVIIAGLFGVGICVSWIVRVPLRFWSSNHLQHHKWSLHFDTHSLPYHNPDPYVNRHFEDIKQREIMACHTNHEWTFQP